MTAIVTSKFRTLNAENFKEDIASASVYVAIGKTDAWSNSTSDTTDTTPFTPYDTTDALVEARENIFALKKLASGDVSHVIPRHTWTSGTSYYAWDSNDPDIFDKAFYIITSEFKVYKCIFAPGTGSTQEPTQTLTSPTAESDLYIWKYMYTVAVADAEKFLTTSYMPVKTINVESFANDAAAETALSEGDYAQYLNQKASRDAATAAGIERVEVTAGGTGYNNPFNGDVFITGAGTGAQIADADVTVTGGVITAVDMTAKGTDYSTAHVVISGGGGSDATVRPVISPENGHGTDPVKELGGFFSAVNTLLDGTGGGDLTVGNDFRQITLVKNPFNFGTSTVSTATTLKATGALSFSSTTSSFQVDELITQGTGANLAQAFVVEVDSGTGYVYYNQNSKTGYGDFVVGTAVSGATSGAQGTPHPGTVANPFLINPEVDIHSGDIIFLENRNPIDRTASQIEDIKIIIEF
jgi:hypothetical protein